MDVSRLTRFDAILACAALFALALILKFAQR